MLKTARIPAETHWALDPRHVSNLPKSNTEVSYPSDADLSPETNGKALVSFEVDPRFSPRAEDPEDDDQDLGDEAPSDPSEDVSLSVANVIRIRVHGMLTPNAAIYRWYGIAAASPDELHAALDYAHSFQVDRIVLDIDSPGGSVSGIARLADRVGALVDAGSPIDAEVNLCASAAYWIGSQCRVMVAKDATAEVGSIGTYMVMVDSSGFFKGAGYDVKLIATGRHKGVGVSGVPIADDQLEPLQAICDDITAIFSAAVAKGRNLSIESVAAVATGETWLAARAEALGLLDGRSAREEKDEDEMTEDQINALASKVAEALASALAAKEPKSSEDPASTEPNVKELAAKELADRLVSGGRLAPVDAPLASQLLANVSPDKIAEVIALFQAPGLPSDRQSQDGDQKPAKKPSSVESKIYKALGVSAEDVAAYEKGAN